MSPRYKVHIFISLILRLTKATGWCDYLAHTWKMMLSLLFHFMIKSSFLWNFSVGITFTTTFHQQFVICYLVNDDNSTYLESNWYINKMLVENVIFIPCQEKTLKSFVHLSRNGQHIHNYNEQWIEVRIGITLLK